MGAKLWLGNSEYKTSRPALLPLSKRKFLACLPLGSRPNWLSPMYFIPHKVLKVNTYVPVIRESTFEKLTSQVMNRTFPFTFALSLSKGRSWFDKPVLSLTKGSPRTETSHSIHGLRTYDGTEDGAEGSRTLVYWVTTNCSSILRRTWLERRKRGRKRFWTLKPRSF